MALLAKNLTAQVQAIKSDQNASTLANVPASGVLNVTSELRGRTNADYAWIQAQTVDNNKLSFFWTDLVPEYTTTGLAASGPTPGAHAASHAAGAADALPANTLAASAAGRGMMANDFFDLATALAKFATDSIDNVWLLKTVKDGEFKADAATRALFADDIWTKAKLPAATAYEDEANTFSQNQSFQALVKLADGSAAAPSATFTSDPNTGLYNKGADQLGFATAGVEAFFIDASQRSAFKGAVFGIDGTAAAPSFGFESDTDTGFFRKAANKLGFTTAGVESFHLDDAQQIVLPAARKIVANGNDLVGGIADKLSAAHLAIANQTVGDLLVADSGTTFARLAAAAAGKILRAAGAGVAPAYSTATYPDDVVKGDILFASAASVVGRLADVAVGSYLRSGGVGADPLWSTLLVPNAGAQGEVPVVSAVDTVTMLGVGTAGQLLRSAGAGATVAWSTAIFPNAATQGDLMAASGANTFGVIAAAAAGKLLRAAGAGVLPAYSTASFPDDVVIGQLLYGSAASTWSALAAPASSGRHLRGVNGAAPAWSTSIWPDDAVAGDLLYASGASTWARLADVAVGQVLASGGVGVAPAWSATPSVTTLTGSTSLLTPLLDTAAATTLAIGTTNATQIDLKQNTTLPTTKTLAVGANTLIGSVADKLNAAHLAIASQAIGDLLFANSTTSFSRLAAVASGQVLTSAGVNTAPAWSASPSLADLTLTASLTLNDGTVVTRKGNGSGTGDVIERIGLTATEGQELVVYEGTISPNAVETNVINVPAGSVILSVQANVQTALTGGGTTVTWSLGTAATPNKYGTAGYPTQADSLAQNSKSNWMGTWAFLTAAEQMVLTGCATGGAADGDTALTVGSVRVRVIYYTLNALDNA